MKRILGFLVALVIFDVLVAQAAKFLLPPNGLTDHRQLEKQYRRSIEPYHHGLEPATEAESRWGPYTFRISTNSLGFKDSEKRQIPLVTDNRRLLFIGDSFTEGVGFPFEETFVGRIATVVHEEDIEVLNAGVASYAPSIYYAKVKYLLEQVGLRFSELIVFIDVSDIHDEGIFYQLTEAGIVVDAPDAPVSGVAEIAEQVDMAADLKNLIKRNSILVRFADLLKDRLWPENWRTASEDAPWFRAAQTSPRSAWTYDQDLWNEYGKAGLARAEVAMTKLAELLDERGIELTIVIYPWPAQIIRPEGNDRYIEFWKSWAERHDALFVDLFPYFTGAHSRDVLHAYYIPLDSHWNADGHAHVAESFLSDYRERSGLR